MSMISVHILQIPSAQPARGRTPRCTECQESLSYAPSWQVIEQSGNSELVARLLCTPCFGVALDRLANHAYDAIEIGL